MKMINVGVGSYINTDKIVLISSSNTNPIRSIIQKAKEDNTLVDVTLGKQVRTAIVTETKVVITNTAPETIAKRFNEEESRCNT